jgi:hypothetical protein
MTGTDDTSQKLDAHIARQAALCQERLNNASSERKRHGEEIMQLRAEMDEMRVELVKVQMALAVQSVKIGVFAALGASIPTIALGIVFLLSR